MQEFTCAQVVTHAAKHWVKWASCRWWMCECAAQGPGEGAVCTVASVVPQLHAEAVCQVRGWGTWVGEEEVVFVKEWGHVV
jgi:hypothetical protein